MASHTSLRRSKPRWNRSKVDGPGAMKKTKIQIGQWASRYAGLLRSRSLRPLASSTRTDHRGRYCPAGFAGAGLVAGAGAAGLGAAGVGAAPAAATFLSYSSMI